MITREFWRALTHRFNEDRCFHTAGVLSYTTLLSIVPLLAVIFGVMALFPVFEKMQSGLQLMLFQNVLPESSDSIQLYLQRFTDQARNMTGAGVATLFVTALLTLATVDRTLNRIWRTTHTRSWLVGFLIYWAILSLGPILITISMAATSYLTSLSFMTDAVQLWGLKKFLFVTTPFLAATVAISLLYWIVPGQKVRFFSALAGGVVAALCFEAAKKGFLLYITYFPTYQAIYGAFAAVPIFLIWIYICWLIILFGAELVYGLDHFSGERQEAIAPENEFYLTFQILNHLHTAYQQGEESSLEHLMQLESDYAPDDIQAALERLQTANYITLSEAQDWLLKRDLNQVTVGDIFNSHHYVTPSQNVQSRRGTQWNGRLVALFSQAKLDLGQTLDIPLVKLFNTSSQ